MVSDGWTTAGNACIVDAGRSFMSENHITKAYSIKGILTLYLDENASQRIGSLGKRTHFHGRPTHGESKSPLGHTKRSQVNTDAWRSNFHGLARFQKPGH